VGCVRIRTFATCAIAAALTLCGSVLIAAEDGHASPVFTAKQADAGRTAYAENCATCHMPDLSGNNEKPPLAGETFMSTWGARSTKDLLDYMSGAMPFGGPSLDADTYLSLTAYVLQSNGALAGSVALTSSTAVRIGSLPCAVAATTSIEQPCAAKAGVTTH